MDMRNFLEHKYTFPAILVAALILRLIPLISAVSDGTRLLRPDSPGYLEPASALVDNFSYPSTTRPPGYPVFAAIIYFLGGNNAAVAAVQLFAAVAACAITGFAAKEYAGKAAGNLAAFFMALNLTAIANTPLLLSDTLFSLFAAGQFYFFVRYHKSNSLKHLCLCTLVAAIAVLIRPINQLMFLVLPVMILLKSNLKWKQKFIHSAITVLLFLAIITPWMTRNYLCGATFDIDTNTGAMRHQNGAMLLAKVNGTDFESEKQKLLEIERQTFPPGKSVSVREKENWRKKEFCSMVMKYPFTYFTQHFDPMILLPDAPSMMENFGITTSDRGTMGVLKKEGLLAAIQHYFGNNWLWMLLLLIPLLLPTMILYAALLVRLTLDTVKFKTCRYEWLIFLAFAEYYLFLPGSITAPRYQLPALPCICTLAASVIIQYFQHKNETVSAACPTVEM